MSNLRPYTPLAASEPVHASEWASLVGHYGLEGARMLADAMSLADQAGALRPDYASRALGKVDTEGNGASAISSRGMGNSDD